MGTCSGCGCHGHSSTCDPVFGHCLVRNGGVTREWGCGTVSPCLLCRMSPSPPRTASTTRRVPSARSANLASSVMPPRARPLPVTLVPVLTPSQLAGGCQSQGPPRPQNITAPVCHRHCHLQVFGIMLFGHGWPSHLRRLRTRLRRPPLREVGAGGPYNPPPQEPPPHHQPIPIGVPRATRETPSSQVASVPQLVSGGCWLWGAPPHPGVPPTLTLAAHRPGARQVRHPWGQG